MFATPFTSLSRPGQLARVFPSLVFTAFAAAALGYGACLEGGVLLPSATAWLAFAAGAALAGGVAGLVLDRIALAPLRALAVELDAARAGRLALEAELASRTEQQRRLRHDLRGAMSPVLLVADRLGAHPDPAVKRSSDIMVRTVERATALLAEPTPPAGP